MRNHKMSSMPASWQLRVVLFLATTAPATTQAADDPLRLQARRRSPPALAASSEPTITEAQLQWAPARTALVICDMWDSHWCQGATRRVAAMAPRMNAVVAAARQRGVFIVHAPSSCMEAYKNTPQRRLAQEAPLAANLPDEIEAWCGKLPGEPALPIDDKDGGCDDQPPCAHGSPWRRQIAAIEIAPQDAVTDSGREFWNLLTARQIDNVIVMGVHTNICVAGRPFALRQLAKNGKNVVLARDMTDSMYNPLRAPFVAHQRGTELVIAHVETYIAPTIHSSDIVGEAPAPRIVFLVGEDEYDTRITLPAFARSELDRRGVSSVFVHENDKSPGDFSGLEAVKSADLLLVSVRRRTPTAAQLALIREHVEAGKALVGIRTASHAFDNKPPADRVAWNDFDRVVLGGHYQGHHGRTPPVGGPSIVTVSDKSTMHPIARGLPGEAVKLDSHLYKCRDLAASTRVIVEGHVEGRKEIEPVAWTNTFKGGRVFYTSLGSVSDFASPYFNQLLVNAIFWALERDGGAARPAAQH